jgi:hypothetical protein
VGELRNLKHHLFQILFAHLFTVFQLPSQDTILNDRNWFISAEENIYPGKNGIVPFILPFTVPQRVVACDIPSNSHIIFVPERVSHGVDSTIETAGKKVFARIGPPFCFLPLEYSASSEFLDTVGASHLVAIAASLATFVELDNFGYFTNVGLVNQHSDNHLLVIWESSGVPLRNGANAGEDGRRRRGHSYRSLSV